MPTITTSDCTEIFYKDWGQGQPIVFSHFPHGMPTTHATPSPPTCWPSSEPDPSQLFKLTDSQQE